ncbi:ATP-binding cassette domain-containing protein [Paenibacillus aurantius]|uniref:ATP-binding cassette domain-containing protein n=1 Tax=Paenibacillus aurantius TaxID=2918900 RepID=A0AA96REW4_9BACL|nr:ATP-binding cassette domain-containing protein [Paenibacillus aurantius]WNQ10633.1 ATP-binding cassette domain-containing protein [Paenibacillus aurantius]
MSAILEVNHLTKRYRNGRGVEDVSFEVAEGEVFGLVGANGAGKTTLLKLLTGLLRPDCGTVRIAGHDIAEQFEQAMERVGCLIETADACGHLTAYEHLKLAARFYPSLPASRIGEALEQAGLAARAKERVAGFSLGMKQRLGLALALLAKPKLVLLDEPSNGLDVQGMIDLRQTVVRLAREEGTAFLLSSHLIHDLSLMVTRTGIMEEGRLIGMADPRRLEEQGTTLEAYAVSQIQSWKEEARYA